MNWFTCHLEKYPENTKSKYSGLMCHWRPGPDSFHCYDFCFKQRMIPIEFDSKDKVNNRRLEKAYLKDRIRPWDDVKLLDGQVAKDFRIWDYGCQFIHFVLLDYRYFPSEAWRNEYCILKISSTDDNDWEIQFRPSNKLEIMKFIQNNWKTLTLDDLENFNKSLRNPC